VHGHEHLVQDEHARLKRGMVVRVIHGGHPFSRVSPQTIDGTTRENAGRFNRILRKSGRGEQLRHSDRHVTFTDLLAVPGSIDARPESSSKGFGGLIADAIRS
jgi:hypothetical protein